MRGSRQLPEMPRKEAIEKHCSKSVGEERERSGKRGDARGEKTREGREGGNGLTLAVDNPAAADQERIASWLASALQDEAHRAFYTTVAAQVPEAVIRDALVRAKDAHNIRKSRAALFTFIVRPHLRQGRRRRSQSPSSSQE